MGNPSLNHRYRKGFYSLFKTLQQNPKIKQQIMRRSKHSILLVDEHKFDSPHFYKIADFADSHSVITNTLPTEDYQKRIDDGITNFI
ncbi:hypothetical protein [Enterococcus faecalis]|uniref:hypothetical protein n=1 Tax=Enterococcus faecalis TaxID=1351 RepID=UPI0024BFC4BD|nr:hypothetical protein [Enterococcus faecalis]MDJ9037402.1 hypothetical protein [Enterococcus faecalis]